MDWRREEKDLFKRALDEFEGGYFYACHDTLEELWREEIDPYIKDFLWAFIQLSIARYHEENQNEVGARQMREKARKKALRARDGKEMLLFFEKYFNAAEMLEALIKEEVYEFRRQTN